MYSRVPECQITTYYYVGFAYLMMRRYQDAIRVFANILLYIQRTRNMFQRSTYKYEMVSNSSGFIVLSLAVGSFTYVCTERGERTSDSNIWDALIFFKMLWHVNNNQALSLCWMIKQYYVWNRCHNTYMFSSD